MASTNPKTILLTGDPISKESVCRTAAITPGMLLERVSNGHKPHGTAAAMAQPVFAREREYVGGNIDTVIPVGEGFAYHSCTSGDVVYALLAAGVNAPAGSFVESNGAGALRLSTHATASATTAAAWPVGVVIESVDNSAGGTVARIKIEVL